MFCSYGIHHSLGQTNAPTENNYEVRGQKTLLEGIQYLKDQNTQEKGNKLRWYLNLELLIHIRALSDSILRAETKQKLVSWNL